MDVLFCIEELNEALSRYGKPDIFNTDQGSQFTVELTNRWSESWLAQHVYSYSPGRAAVGQFVECPRSP